MKVIFCINTEFINIKYALNVYELFQSRYKLFKFAYLNSVALAIDLMTIDALKEANLYYNFKEIINDPNEY